jgi:hypothetical protein
VPRNFRIVIFLYKKKDKSNNIFRGLNGGPVENEVIGRQTVQVKNRDKIRCVAVKYRERGMHGDLVPESVDMRKAVKVIYFATLLDSGQNTISPYQEIPQIYIFFPTPQGPSIDHHHLH